MPIGPVARVRHAALRANPFPRRDEALFYGAPFVLVRYRGVKPEQRLKATTYICNEKQKFYPGVYDQNAAIFVREKLHSLLR